MQKVLTLIITLIMLSLPGDYAHALCVSAQDANLRKGPGTKYEKTWEVFKYMPFKKISTKGNWYKVKDVDGDVHWVYKKLVTTIFKCAVVKVDKANVRSGPGVQHSKTALSPALKYDVFKVVQTKSSWVKLVDEFGDTGWILGKLLWVQ